MYGSKLEEVQGRYAVIPGVLLLFTTYRMFQILSGNFKVFCIVLISISLIAGSYEYKSNNKYKHFLTCINCPDWKNEVSKWRKDDTYILKIWMYPRKMMNLKK